jgi:hypothetical protein
MSFDASQLLVPDWMQDEENQSNPLGSRRIRQAHVEAFAEERYATRTILAMASQNDVDGRVTRVLQDAANAPDDIAPFEPELCLGAGTSATEVLEGADESARSELKHACGTELWLSLAARTANSFVCPFIVIALSLMALKCGMPDECWQMLQFLFVLRSKTWITSFAGDVAERLRERLHQGEDMSWNVRFVVGDNCSYHLRTVFEHTDRAGEFLHTVNWITVLLSKQLLQLAAPIARGQWRQTGFSRWSIRHQFNPHAPANVALKDVSWRSFLRIARAGGDITAHPDVAKPERSRFIFETPVLDAGTAAYKDVDRFLTAVRMMFLFLIGLPQCAWRAAASVVLVVGDQQTYSRMLWLKLYHPSKYDWVVPLPGEFHFTVHALMAIHKLWWRSLIRWVVTKLGAHNTIKHVWTSVEECKHYDHVYRLAILTLAMYLAEVVPISMLYSPVQLRRAVRANGAALLAIRFLYEFGFPWLALRQAIRANNADVINVMWRVTYHWFAATGKTNYRIMSVMVTYFLAAMVAPLQSIWTLMRTASLSGFKGRNVGWDFVVERFNRMSKQALGQRVSRMRVLYFIPILNAFQHIWPRFLRAIGRPEPDASDYTRHTQSDVDVMMAAWREALGADFDELCAERDVCVFDVDDSHGGPSSDPWERVLEYVISVHDQHRDEDEDDAMDGMEEEWEVEGIEDARGSGSDREWYVRWKGYTERTWEPRENLTDCAEMLAAFERQSTRTRSSARGSSGRGGHHQEPPDDGNGDDPDEEYEIKISWWYRDVTDILKTRVPDV